jgi:hypothetical protein
VKRAIPLVITALVLAAVASWFLLRNEPQDYALAAREMATRRLAEYLARKFPGHRARLISNPFVQNAHTSADIVQTENAGIEGFRKGAADKLALEAIAFPELKPDARTNPRAVFIDGETTTPLSFLVSPDGFDKLAAQHPQAGLFVSLIGLPVNVKELRCWQEGKPAFALLLPDLRFVGNAAAVKQAVQKGKIAAMVLQKPGAPSVHQGVSEKDFDRLFILVTPENIERAMTDYPQLFPPN